jgi:cation transporter-like permease
MKKISEEVNQIVLNESQMIEVENASEQIVELIKKGEIDESVIKSIVGGLTGVTIGPSIGKAICKALGIEKGLLYDLFTSRIFTTAVATYIGYKN